MNNLDLTAAQTAQAMIQDTTTFKASEVENLASNHSTNTDNRAKTTFKASEVENLATKALGVLQENGVYALMLYLFSRTGKEKEIAPTLRTKLLAQIKTLALGDPPANAEASPVLNFLTETIINDLDTLLLLKQVWEQTLIYVRYGAKARGEQ